MPLIFPSASHGAIAFGFFNVETDCLLLDRVFFFCADFCRAVSELAAAPEGIRSLLPGFSFSRREEIGDLRGAIHGTRHEGFLGEVYRLWPFPADPGEFRQKLRGAGNRGPVEALLRSRASPASLVLAAEPGNDLVRIGPYAFTRRGFADLIEYVLRGGYPTWEGYEEGGMPEYVRPLRGAVRVFRQEPSGLG
jgi:hypothetical protein